MRSYSIELLGTGKGKLPSDWPEDIVRLTGKIAIAFSQLEFRVLRAAKRLDSENLKLNEFAKKHRRKNFDCWCKVIINKTG